MFAITRGKGFHLTFANGWTVSVQWGNGNYCSNRCNPDPKPGTDHTCVNAEVLCWKEHAPEEDVKSYVSAEEVARFIFEVSTRPN